MTLAVDTYIEVRLRQMQLHLGHLSNVFAHHETFNYLFLMSQHDTPPAQGQQTLLHLTYRTRLQDQYPVPSNYLTPPLGMIQRFELRHDLSQ